MPEFELLPGLPAYGAIPEQFSDTGRGTHREGLVVRFDHPLGHRWVGNFQRGFSRFDAAHRHPDGARVVIVAGGTAYVVDPVERRCVDTFGGAFEHALESEGTGLLVLADWTHILVLGADGAAWRTGRVSLDGIRNLNIADQKLVGQGWWGAGDDDWSRFEVDLTNGKVTGRCLDES